MGGLMADGDELKFEAYRRAEIKHGRVCMSSTLGMLVSEKFHPIFDAWGDEPFVSAMQSHFSETATKNFWPAFWLWLRAMNLPQLWPITRVKKSSTTASTQ